MASGLCMVTAHLRSNVVAQTSMVVYFVGGVVGLGGLWTLMMVGWMDCVLIEQRGCWCLRVVLFYCIAIFMYRTDEILNLFVRSGLFESLFFLSTIFL